MKTDEFTSSLIIHFSFPTSRQSKEVFHHIHLINYSIKTKESSQIVPCKPTNISRICSLQ